MQSIRVGETDRQEAYLQTVLTSAKQQHADVWAGMDSRLVVLQAGVLNEEVAPICQLCVFTPYL